MATAPTTATSAAEVTKITNMSVMVQRNGKNVLIRPGKKFNFTQEEVDHVLKSFPKGLRDLVREAPLAVEDPADDEAETKPAPAAARVAPAKGAAKAPKTDPDDDVL